MNRSKEVPSLRELATRAVYRRYLNVKGVVPLMQRFEEIDWMIVNGPELRQRCIQFIVSTYSSIRQKYPEEEMESLIGKELKSNLDQETEELRKEIKRIKKLRGSVMQRLPSPGSYSKEIGCHVPKLTRSVSGKSAYPYESLQTGREWPSDVNPSRREEHLDTDEFQDIFQISYDTYCSYPDWKRVQIKKEKKLF